MRRRALPCGDVAALRRVVRRTALVRTGLALALGAALAAGVAAAREPRLESAGLLPSQGDLVVVLDASASVEGSSRIAEVLPELYDNPNLRIRAALQTLAERDQPLGLVLFSDVAYELLPPGSPGSALAPLQRFFTPTSQDGLDFLTNPWTRSFSGGTLISAGLSKALEVLARDGIERASILLLSDLDAPDDPALEDVLARIRDAGIELRIVSLVSDPEREELFREVLGDGAFVDPDELERTVAPTAGVARLEGTFLAPSPVPTIVAGAVLLLLLALHERLLARLPIPERSGR